MADQTTQVVEMGVRGRLLSQFDVTPLLRDELDRGTWRRIVKGRDRPSG
jgi:hypothetical protein